MSERISLTVMEIDLKIILHVPCIAVNLAVYYKQDWEQI